MGLEALPATALVHLLGDVDVALLDGGVGDLDDAAIDHRDLHAAFGEAECRAGPAVDLRRVLCPGL